MAATNGQALFFGCFGVLASTLLATNFVIFPVLLQMILYTFPIIYVGSHLSLKQAEMDPVTGEKPNRSESMDRKDAMMFPIFGSMALCTLYMAYKFFDAWYVNMLLTTYLTLIGVLALGETLSVMMFPVFPRSLNDSLSVRISLPMWPFGTVEAPMVCSTSWTKVFAYVMSIALGFLWMSTKHWLLHNMFAIAFCIQAIAIISVGSFTVAAILLSGLFVYDIFWVFGTEVMVTVAKSFEGPVKLIFPVGFDPWQQSILGLGDVVIPGIFISICLRFDNWLHERVLYAEQKKKDGDDGKVATKGLDSIDIHAKFNKFYFWIVTVSYELGLLTTGVVMAVFQHPQPALLYLVPYCLVSLFGAAILNGEVKDILAYKEDDGEAEGNTTDAPAIQSEEVKPQ